MSKNIQSDENRSSKFAGAGVFVFSILIGVAAMYIFYIKMDNILTNYFAKTLRTIGEARAEQVRLFLEGKQNRVIDFSSDGFIKDSLYNINNGNNAKETVAKLNRHLMMNKMPVDKHFYNVFALGVDGIVVSSTNKDAIGTDLSGDRIFLDGRGGSYIKSLSYDNIANVKSLVLSAPVVRENEFVGVIAIKMLPDDLINVVMKKNSFKTFETYIINESGYLITPSKFLEGENRGILTQMVDSENSKKCLQDLAEGEHKSEGDPIMFVDYRGEDVVGSHHIIPEINWCLLAEIDYSEIWEGKKEGFKIAILLLLVGSGLASLVVSFVVRKKRLE